MIYKPTNRRYYRVKLRFKGRLVHRSTGATDARTARTIDGEIRAELARGNWASFDVRQAAKLSEFLRKDFLPKGGSRRWSTPTSAYRSVA